MSYELEVSVYYALLEVLAKNWLAMQNYEDLIIVRFRAFDVESELSFLHFLPVSIPPPVFLMKLLSVIVDLSGYFFFADDFTNLADWWSVSVFIWISPHYFNSK